MGINQTAKKNSVKKELEKTKLNFFINNQLFYITSYPQFKNLLLITLSFGINFILYLCNFFIFSAFNIIFYFLKKC